MHSESGGDTLTPKRRRIEKPLRKLLFFVVALMGLFAVAVGVMSTAWFRRFLERQMVTHLQHLTGGRVKIRAMYFQPTILQVTIKGLTVHGEEAPSEPPLLVAETVVARLNFVPLSRRRLRLRSLDWENAELHVVTKRDGSTNLPGPRTSSSADRVVAELIELSIRRFTVTRSRIDWNEQRLPLELDGQDLNLSLRLHGAQRYAGSLSSFSTKINTPRWSLPPVSFTSEFEISRGALDISSLAWHSAGVTGQCSLSLRNPVSPEGIVSFQARGEIAEFTRPLGLTEWRGGSLNVEGQLIYRQGEMTAQGQLQAREVIFKSSEFSSGRIDLSSDYLADRYHIEFSNLQVRGLGGSAQGQAEVSLRGPTPDFSTRGQVRGMDLAAALRTFPRGQPFLSRLRYAARVDGTVEASWSGRLENLKSQFDLEFRSVADRVPGLLPVSGHARGQVTMARGFLLDLGEAKFQTPKTALSAQGKLGAAQSNLAFQLVTSDVEEWRPFIESLFGTTETVPLSLESSTSFAGTASGSYTRPEIRGRLETGKFTYRGWRWDSLAASFIAARDSIEISSAHLRRERSALILSASAKLQNWALAPSSPVHLSARAQRTPVEGLEAALGVRHLVGGLATGHLDIEGTTRNLAGEGALRIEQVILAGESFDSLSAKIRMAGSVWMVQGIQLTKGQGQLTGELQFRPSDRFFSAEFRGSEFSLAESRRLSFPESPPPRSPYLNGRASFDLRGEGIPEDVRLHSSLSIRDIRLNGTAVGDLRGQLDWQGKQMQVEGRVEGPGGLVRFRGGARTEGSWPLELDGQYENLRADPWIHLLLKNKFNAAVTASGSFSLTGPLEDPGQLVVRNQAQELEVRFPSITWKNEHPVDLRYAGGVLIANRFRMRGPSTNLEVEGSIRFGEPTTLSLNAQGQAEAALLSLINPALQATGRSDLKLRISGTAAQPLLDGTLNVHDMSMSYSDLPFRVTGLNGEIRLEGGRATASSLRGASGGGSVTLAGFVTLSEMPRFDLRANLDQVRVRYPSDFTSVLNGNLRLAGTPERGQLSGELTVRQMTVSENFNLLARALEGVNPLGEHLPGIASPLASMIRLNVQVNSASSLRLETRDLILLADLDLRIQGTLASPVGVGLIHFQSGEAVLRGNRYKLTRGEIRMSNPLRTQPLLDLEATTRVQRYDLTVDISGSPDRPKVAFRSDPPLPTTDILSLLALGFSRRPGEMSTVAGGPLPTVEAGALLSEALSSQVTGRVQRLFGTSHIKIDPNVGGPGNAGGARVTVEQQIRRDLTITYVTNTASSQYRIIQFDWALSENTSLVGVRDQNGIFGMELKFRHRFR